MTDSQFLIQIIVQIGGVVATLALAWVAIWGDQIKAKWFGPSLKLDLFSPGGERQQRGDGSWGRYYHLRVTNTRPHSIAKNVRVVLTGIARPDANGQFQWDQLSGPIQFTWQHSPQYVALGPRPQNADLGVLLQQGAFDLSLPMRPIGLQTGIMAHQSMMVSVLAVSDETESAPLCVKIAWGGGWSDDTAEMRKRLIVEVVHEIG